MNHSGLETATVLKILLGVVALIVAAVVLGTIFRFLTHLIWLAVGVAVLVVLVLLAIRLLGDLL